MSAASDPKFGTGPSVWRVQPALAWQAATIGLVISASVSLAFWHWAAGLLLLVCLFAWLRSRWVRSEKSAGVLIRKNGQWFYRQAWRRCALGLNMAWPSAQWITLRFQPEKSTPHVFFEITIRKRGLPPGAWQGLCMHVAQDLQFPTPGGQVDRT